VNKFASKVQQYLPESRDYATSNTSKQLNLKMDAGELDHVNEAGDSEQSQSELLDNKQNEMSEERPSEHRRSSCGGPAATASDHDIDEQQTEEFEDDDNATNEDDDNATNEDEKSDRNEKVLIEKDGKFELVSASEVKAQFDRSQNDIEPQLREHKENGVMTTDSSEEFGKCSAAALRDSTDFTEEVKISKDHETVKTEDAGETEDACEENKPEENKDNVSRTDSDEDAVLVSARETRRVSADSVPKSDSQLLEKYQFQATRSQSAYSLASHRGNLAEIRSKSKQSRRSTQQSQGDESANRKQAQEAFRVWLAAKAEQKQKEKALKVKLEQEQKQSMGWAIRPPATRKDCDARFQEWLDEKKYQKQRERQLQNRLKQLMEEEKVQPSQEEIDRAYKQ
jgi:hypothetical protein